MINLIIQILFIFVIAMLIAAWIDHKTRHWASVFRVTFGLLIGLSAGIAIVFVTARHYLPAVF